MNSDNKNELPSALSLTLVGIQFVLIGLIVFIGPLWPQEWSLRGILGVSGLVGLWALQVMGLRQVKVFPEISGQGKLMSPTEIRQSALSLLCGSAGCVDVRKVCQKEGVS